MFSLLSGFTQRTRVIQDLVIAGYKDTFQTSSQPGELTNKVASGVSVGLAYDAGLRRLHLKPELRYSLWFSRGFQERQPVFSTPRHELEFLLGIEFGGHS